MNAKQCYTRVLRTIAGFAIISFAFLVVCADWNETREPWEFVPVTTQ